MLSWFKTISTTGLLLFAASAYAADTYDSVTNQLTIPSVLVSGAIYTNVVVTVGSIINVGGGAAAGTTDTYDVATNQLTIHSVLAGGVTYTNVVITVGNLIGIGGNPANVTSTLGMAVIDGSVSSVEWGVAAITTRIDMSFGVKVHFRNDSNMLYILLDDVNDTTNNNSVCTYGAPPFNSWSCTTQDWAEITFDMDRDSIFTADVDYSYGMCQRFTQTPPVPPIAGFVAPQTAYLSRIRLVTTNSSNGCGSGGATQGLMLLGFGPTFNSNTPHRFFEISIPLNELCVDPSKNIHLDLFRGVPWAVNMMYLTLQGPIQTSNKCMAADFLSVVPTGVPCVGHTPPLPSDQFYEVRNSHPSMSINATVRRTDTKLDFSLSFPPFDTVYTVPPGGRASLSACYSFVPTGLGSIVTRSWAIIDARFTPAP